MRSLNKLLSISNTELKVQHTTEDKEKGMYLANYSPHFGAHTYLRQPRIITYNMFFQYKKEVCKRNNNTKE